MPIRDRLARDMGPNLVVVPGEAGLPRQGRNRLSTWLESSSGLAFGLVATTAVLGAWSAEGGTPHRSRIVLLTIVLVGASLVAWFMSSRHIGRTRSQIRHRAGLVMACTMAVAGFASMRSATEWRSTTEVNDGPYVGEARIVADAMPRGRGTRVVLEIEHQRFEAWFFGSKVQRLDSMRFGDIVWITGKRTAFASDIARRMTIRHILGRVVVSEIGSLEDGSRRSAPVIRAANRIRDLLKRGAKTLPADRESLFTGLVYGDDSTQSREMVDRFRSSGLAHLTAVSGQNVAFILQLLRPALARLHRPTRIGFTLLVLVWFAVMTRVEASVVRAAIMAGVSATMVASGRPVSSWIALTTTVSVAVLVDPFLVWSVGWWLSVAGCAGLTLLTPALLGAVSRCPTWFASWVAPTIAAQLGVLPVSASVFGWPSAVAVPCNLLAAPVAGVVMMVGLPIAALAGAAPTVVANAAMALVGVGVAWVDGIARIGASVDPPVWVDIGTSAVLGLVFAVSLVRPAKSRRGRIDSV